MINEIDYRKGDESNVSKNKFQENNIRFSCEIWSSSSAVVMMIKLVHPYLLFTE